MLAFKLIRRLIVILSLPACVATLFAADYHLNIKVIDSATGQAVRPGSVALTDSRSGQRISLPPLASGKTTLALPEGSYALKIDDANYRPFSAQVTVGPDTLPIQVQLEPLVDPAEIQFDTVTKQHRGDAMLILGYVVDDETGLPLEGVRVSAKPGGSRTATDARGFFQFHVPLRSETSWAQLKFDKQAYRSELRENVELWPNGDAVMRVRLTKGTGENVVAEHERRRPQPKAVSTSISEPISLSRPVASTAESADLQPPVAMDSGSPTNLSVRVPTNIRVLLTNGTVEYVSMELYVRRSVSKEWIPSWGNYPGGSSLSWGTNSLKAGAVAVRTYAAGYVNNPAGADYDICATTTCQVYGSTTHSATDLAVNTTPYYVMVNSSGSLGFKLTEYSSENNQLGQSCGDGYTAPTGGCLADPVCTGENEFGHGRGMCQWGTVKWATGLKFPGNGFSNTTMTNNQPRHDWIWICEHYFPNLRLVQGQPLVIGDAVVAGSSVSVRECAGGTITDGTNCTLIATKSAGSTGTIIGGPQLITSDGSGFTWWRIQWSDSTIGWSAENYIQRDIPTPVAPTGFQAEAVSASQIDLSWTDGSTTEIGFKVERATASGGPFTQIIELNTNATSYVDTGLDAGKTYYYRVCAFNLGGNSTKRSANATTYDNPPTLAAIADQTVTEGSTLTFTATATAPDFATLLSDFESYSSGTEALFRTPRLSGSTSSMLDSSPNISTVADSFPSGSGLGSRTLNVNWSWNSSSNPWLRLTTASAANLPNPVINFTKKLRFDIHSDKSVKIALGCRETTTAAGTPIGSDGGLSGAIEWAGATGVTGSSPNCTRTISANTWTTVTFDLPNEAIRSFSSGNNILSTASGLGVLEHLAFVPNSGIGAYEVYLDNFAVTEPKTLTFTLEPGAPSGASIHPTTGVFSWTPSIGQGPNTYNITVRVTDNGTPNQSDTKTFSVTVNAPPRIASEPENQTVVQGNNATFNVIATGTAPLTYQWKFNGVNIADATTSSYTRVNAQPADAGDYTVAITNAYGNALSAAATLTVNVSPSISSQPQNQTVNEGGTANFSVSASGTAPLSYRWKKGNAFLNDGGNVSGSATATLSLSNVGSGDAANYSVVITNIAGNVTSDAATLTVNLPPTVDVPPQNQTATVGSNVTFTVTASGTAPFSYQWQKDGVDLSNGGNVSGASSATLSLASITINDAGAYRVVVTNVAGAVTSSSGTLTVNVPPSITSQPTNQTIAQGASFTFSVVATGTSPLSYQWRRDGADIANATASSYTKANAQVEDSAEYSVVVTNVAGLVVSSNATLIVQPANVEPPSIITHPTNQLVNFSSNVTMVVVATGNTLSYQWRKGGLDVSGATGSSLTFTNVQLGHAGTYSVVVSNSAGVAISSNAVLTVNADFSSPILKITAPLASQRLFENVKATNYSTLIYGTAADATGVSVQLKLNENDWQPVVGTTNWSLVVTNLIPGTNTVTVKATDPVGNPPTQLTRKFVYVVTSPFTLNILGVGSVTPTNLHGQQLEVGKNYKLTASTGTNTSWAFTNWTRVQAGVTNAYSPSNVLTFMMESNLVLNANFITNPFVRAAGVYNGLFAETNGVTHHSAGYFTLRVTAKLGYTGKLLVGGNSITVSGKFDIAGNSSKVFSRARLGKPNLTLNLALDLTNWTEQITGSVVASNAWTAVLDGDRWTWTTNNMPVSYTNKYTMAFEGFSDPVVGPPGWSVAYITIDKLGRIALSSSALADGHLLKQSTTLSKYGDWPFYAQAYIWTNVVSLNSKLITNREYQGTVIGWLRFDVNTNAGTTNLAPLGTVNWMKVGWTNALYPNGFTNSVDILGSLQTSTSGVRVLNLTTGEVVMTGGNLNGNFTNIVSLATNNIVKNVQASLPGLVTTIAAKSGLMSGSFTHPSTGLKQSYKAAILQDYNTALGYFTNVNRGGTVTFDPVP